jgi:hypothetical protein
MINRRLDRLLSAYCLDDLVSKLFDHDAQCDAIVFGVFHE